MNLSQHHVFLDIIPRSQSGEWVGAVWKNSETNKTPLSKLVRVFKTLNFISIRIQKGALEGKPRKFGKIPNVELVLCQNFHLRRK